MNHRLLTCAFALTTALASMAQAHVMDVNTKKAGATVQNTMYGLFFEDINYAADGGLYGELVKNRSFEFPQAFMGWQTFGNVTLKDDGPFERCPHYVSLAWAGHTDRRTGLVNEGYFGIGVLKGEEYRFTVWARAPKGTARIRVQLIDANTMGERQDFATAKVDVKGTEWKKYEVRIKSPRTDNKAMLVLIDDENRLDRYINDVPEIAYQLIEVADKPLTIIYDDAKNLAPNIIGSDKSIGIRVTREDFSRELCRRFGRPVVSTSANVSGAASAHNFHEIQDEIKNGVDYIVNYRQNDNSKHNASSIIKLQKDGAITILRK